MSRRAGIATAILVLWMAGLGLLARREFFGGAERRLAAAFLLVDPGSEYYAVMQGDRQIGFASSSIDTTARGIEVTDFFLADLEADRAMHRAAARVTARLNRRLALTAFQFELGPEVGPLLALGTVSGDTLLTLSVAAGGEPADTQYVKLDGPIMLPTTVPLAIALTDRPRVGRRYSFSVFDPMAMAPAETRLRIVAESLFVLSDSAGFDAARGRWVSARDDTVRAWRVEPDSGRGSFAGWVDARGRVVEASQFGNMAIKRMAYEIAFNNWTSDPRRVLGRSEDRDIQETTAIAATARIDRKRYVQRLRVRLRNAELGRYDLEGERQRLIGDTLQVTKETQRALRATYRLPADPQRFASELASEPLVQVHAPEIRELAARIAGGERDPRVVAERINRWVNDSLEKRIMFTVPNAVQVLRTRRGDCNEHTQLYVALARAAGIPTRSVAGLAYVAGKFYYHAWPEVFLGDWVAVDPTFGQFPADAAHLRFVIGGFTRQAELLRLIGRLQIDLVSAD